ncbi:MAG: LysR family transcriptional regulator [Saprospiraceae bacterium]|nr:LysR family transcriptional regulator [Saprospiraceae bacterium]
MNIQQLEYILAVDAHRHFAKAAGHCHVTQPTLSMMVQKLEEEIGVKIFDRSRQPVVPTQVGEALLAQARVVLRELDRFAELARAEGEGLRGELRIGIIPTLSPYLLPLFLQGFVDRYPDIRLKINERTTAGLIGALHKGHLDAAILVTPLNDPTLREDPLFYEPFVVYSGQNYPKQYLLPEDIDPNQLWLLEEGHCFRSQILNICELRRKDHLPVEYEAGSLETLKQLVDAQNGITILPELATLHLTAAQLLKVKRFAAPEPVREVSIVTHRHLVKQRLVEALKGEILEHLPPGRVRLGAEGRVAV